MAVASSSRARVAASKKRRPARSRSLTGLFIRKTVSGFVQTVTHLVLPTERNKRRAKLLHTDSLVALSLVTLAIHVFLALAFHFPVLPSVLGADSKITESQVLDRINLNRQDQGLAPLTLNKQLSQAAQAKGKDMLSNGYWSHQSPAGKEPWDFIAESGYEYSVAGENLARNFSDSNRLVAAWMSSPTHKANILHDEYTETGLAVVEGKMNGKNTTLVVQLFSAPETSVPSALAQQTGSMGEAFLTASRNEDVLGIQNQLAITPMHFYRFGILSMLFVLTVVHVVDMTQAKKNRWQRNQGRGLAHLTIFIAVMATIALTERGTLL